MIHDKFWEEASGRVVSGNTKWVVCIHGDDACPPYCFGPYGTREEALAIAKGFNSRPDYFICPLGKPTETTP